MTLSCGHNLDMWEDEVFLLGRLVVTGALDMDGAATQAALFEIWNAADVPLLIEETKQWVASNGDWIQRNIQRRKESSGVE